MQRSHVVVAPHRIIDPVLERVVYAKGQAMTNEDAIKYGVLKPSEVEDKKAEHDPPKSPERSRKRAVKPQQDRAVKPESDRSEVEPLEAPEPAPKGRPRKTAG